jgi:hypothetical protein
MPKLYHIVHVDRLGSIIANTVDRVDQRLHIDVGSEDVASSKLYRSWDVV